MQPFSFQRIAPYYDFLAKIVFGSAIDDAQKFFFSHIPKGSSILIIGGGSGKILPDLTSITQPKNITYVEDSLAMLKLTEKRFSRIKKNNLITTKVLFIHGTEYDIPEEDEYDVLMTFFFLDMYPTREAKVLAANLSKHLKPSGSWLFADFCLQGSTWRQRWQKVLLKLMYKFFWITIHLQNQSLPDYQRIFKELYYFPVQQKYFYRSFIISTIYRKLLA